MNSLSKQTHKRASVAGVSQKDCHWMFKHKRHRECTAAHRGQLLSPSAGTYTWECRDPFANRQRDSPPLMWWDQPHRNGTLPIEQNINLAWGDLSPSYCRHGRVASMSKHSNALSFQESIDKVERASPL